MALYPSSNYSPPPTLGCQTTHLDPAPQRNTKVGSKTITIMEHYHSSSSIDMGSNDHLRAPEITSLIDIRPNSNNKMRAFLHYELHLFYLFNVTSIETQLYSGLSLVQVADVLVMTLLAEAPCTYIKHTVEYQTMGCG